MLKGCIKKAGVKQFICPHGYVNEKQNHSTATSYLLLTMHPLCPPLPISRLCQASEQPFRTLGASITERNVILELNVCKIALGTSQSFNKTEKQLQADARHTLVSVQLSPLPGEQLSSPYLDVRISFHSPQIATTLRNPNNEAQHRSMGSMKCTIPMQVLHLHSIDIEKD
jgi:hypothetical protein